MDKLSEHAELFGLAAGAVSLSGAGEVITAVGAIASAICAVIALCKIVVKAGVRIARAVKNRDANEILSALDEAEDAVNEIKEGTENGKKDAQ